MQAQAYNNSKAQTSTSIVTGTISFIAVVSAVVDEIAAQRGRHAVLTIGTEKLIVWPAA